MIKRLFLLFSLSSSLLSQTYVSGEISGTWTSAGSPYYVTDQCTVSTGNSLTIQSGVEIYFRGDYSFIIQGVFTVQGTVDDSVYFSIDTSSTSEFGGIRFIDNSIGTISFSRIENSVGNGTLYMEQYGGAIYFNGSSIIISNCEIYNCSATLLGGAIGIDNTSAIVENCKIHHDSSRYGGGIFTNSFDTIIKNNYIYSNIASLAGGGFHATGLNNQPRLENNIFYNNSAREGGGVGFIAGNEALLINNIFYNNSASRYGGAAQVKFHFDGSSPVFYNNIIWNNTAASEGSQIYIETNATLDIDFCDIDGGEAGIVNYGTLNYGSNNINLNPIFNDPNNADFTFEANSPLVDSGTNTGAPSTDFGGNSRPFDGDRDATAVVDIGAYEYINTVPVITTTPVTSVDEDQPYTYDVDADDPDAGETLTYSLTAGPLFLSINSATGGIAGLPDNDDVGPNLVRVEVSDRNGATDIQQFTLTVNNTNDPPTLENTIPDQQATEDVAYSFAFAANTFNDQDPGDNLTYSATLSDDSPLPAWLTFTPGTRTFSGTPTNRSVGTITVKVTATDNSEESVSDEFNLEVVNTNDAPTVANEIPDQQATEEVAYTFAFAANTFNDVDVGDNFLYSATLSDDSPLPGWLTFTPATRTFSGTPSNSDVGTITIRVTATDDSAASVFDEFYLEVINENDPPTLENTIPDQQATEDVTYSFVFAVDTFNDQDPGDNLTYSATLSDDNPLPSWLTFTPGTRTFSGTPTNSDVGTITVKVTATDNSAASVSDEFILEVVNTNDAPTVANEIPDQQATEDVAYSFAFAANAFDDVDAGDNLTYSATLSDDNPLPAWLTFTPATRTFSGTPANTDVGTITVKVTAMDDSAASVSDEFDLEVINTNDPPVISDLGNQVLNEDDSLTYTISELLEYVHDPDHLDSLLIFIPDPGENVTVSLVGDSLVIFSAPVNWNGFDTLSVIVTDGELADSALIYFEVKPVNDTPFFEGLPDTVEMYLMAEEEMNIGDFADDYDFDMPKDSLRWEVSVSDDTLKFDFDPDTKDLTLTAPEYADVFTVTITVTDDSGATAVGSFYVNVTYDPTAIENINSGIPTSYVLKQNYPNPFNPTTHIKFDIPQAGDVLMEVYNLLGQKIVTLFDGYKAAGYHVVDFNASNLPTGIYFYRIKADKFRNVKKMMLVK